MAYLDPQLIAQVGDIPFQYGLLTQPPIAIHAPALALNSDSHATIDGRFHESTGEIRGAATVKRQATFIVGTPNRTGRAFTANSGTWLSTAVDPQYDQYGLEQVNGTSDAPIGEVVSATTTTRIEHALVVLHRDFAATGSNPVAGWRSGYSAYVHFAYLSPDGLDYRVAVESGQPIRVDFTSNGGATWRPVSLARKVGDSDAYLKHNRGEFRFKAMPDHDDVKFELELGDGHFLRTSNGPMPVKGNIRLLTAGGSVRFWYYPLRYTPATAFHQSPNLPQPVKNLDKAQVLTNGRITTPADQTTKTTLTSPNGKNLAAKVTATRKDAGDGLGSPLPPRLSDITIYVPAAFTDSADGHPDGNVANLRTMRLESLGLFDDVTCTTSYAANLLCNNWDGAYNGAYGRYAIALDASNGGAFYRQCTGIAGGGSEGMRVVREDPTRLLYVPVQDCSCQLMRALAQEVEFDGWAWCAAIWFLALAGGIAPQWLQYIPYWPPGKAGADCPHYILRSGSGLNAAWRYYRQSIIWAAMQEIVATLPALDPTTGLPLPYYLGFDEYRYLHCEPVSFVSKTPTAFYSMAAHKTGGVPIEKLEVFTSVADMRSSIDLFGIDPQSFELLYLHQAQDPSVLKAMGYPLPLVIQSPTFVSEDYMAYVAQAMAIPSSLPLQTVRMKVPFIPTTQPGAVVWLWAKEVGGLQRMKIDVIRSVVGYRADHSGKRDCYSVIDCRNVFNTL